MNVFDYAIRMEEHGAKLFERLEHDSQDPELREIFCLLAAREWEHIASLTTRKEVVTPEEACSSMAERALNIKSGYEKLLENSDIFRELRTDPDGFRHIVRTEEENIRMLAGMAAAEPNETAGLLLYQLAEDERKQLTEIEYIYDFIEAPHTYLEWGEFSNLRSL